MSDPNRFDDLAELAAARDRRRRFTILVATIALGAAASATMIITGIIRGGPELPALAAAGGLGVVICIVAAGMVGAFWRSRARAGDGDTRPQLEHLSRAIEQLVEHGALSDDARRVLNRRRDREILCKAIQEDIEAEDWDAAMVLVKELAERFGYRSDAEEFRQRIEHARFETVQRKVLESITRIDWLTGQRRWDQALTEAGRTSRLYPDSPQAEGLRHRVEHARAMYKSDLERRFLLCAEQSRIDEAMELLKELDAYLSEAEAGPYREVARGVIGKARENLGAHFKLAVQDRQWDRAAAVGQRIIEQFPNSRMAQEVRQMLDGIRARANQMPAA
ncbi:MAG: hypothetical protein WD749_03980 [Phycisphaerales bacterium]